MAKKELKNRYAALTRKKWEMDRRTFLRGAVQGVGFSLGLPFLDIMLPSVIRESFGATDAPLRFGVFSTPNGSHMDDMSFNDHTALGGETIAGPFPRMESLAALEAKGIRLPKTVGAYSDATGESRRGLQGLRDLLNFYIGYRGEEGHEESVVGLLSGNRVAKGASSAGKTFDQHVADHFRAQQLSYANYSLNVLGGVWTGNGGQYGEGGETYGGTDENCRRISASANGPITPIVNLPAVLKAVFSAGGGSIPGGPSAALLAAQRNKSLIDYILPQARSLRMQLPTTDRIKLDDYLDSVRELEGSATRTIAIESSATPTTAPQACVSPTLDGSSHKAQTESYMKAFALMFQCNITPVLTYMFQREVSKQVHGWLTYSDQEKGAVQGNSYNNGGTQYTHHNMSHSGGNHLILDALARIDRWHMSCFADLCHLLHSKKEGNGKSVLENSALFYTSNISTGQEHQGHGLPLISVGGLNGKLNTGFRYIVNRGFVSTKEGGPRGYRCYVPNDYDFYKPCYEPIGSLWLTIGQALGMNMTSFGTGGNTPLNILKKA